MGCAQSKAPATKRQGASRRKQEKASTDAKTKKKSTSSPRNSQPAVNYFANPEAENPPQFAMATKKQEKELSEAEKKALCEQYGKLEAEIQELEKKNTQNQYQTLQEQVADLTQTIKSLNEACQKATQKVAKEKKDVDQMQDPSVKKFFANQADFDAKLSKEQEEHLEAVNEAEMLKTQLTGVVLQMANAEKEVKALEGEVKKLNDLYKKQDDILDSIFEGKYGSELENKLEGEADVLADKEARISVARYKWVNSRTLLQHACTQLAHACRKWTEVAKMPRNNNQQRYLVATEARNNLIAARQNILSAQRYLSSITFPYCQPKEMETLDKATTNIYTDMQSTDRHKHAMQCYTVTHKRAAALLQWFDNVIDKTINKDLEKAVKEHAAKEQELKKERIRLMKEMTGVSLNIADRAAQKMAMSTGDDAPVTEAVKVEGQSDKPDEAEDDGKLTPLPLSELAPLPSQEDLFGNADKLKQQHAKDMAEFEKTQAMNKARVEQGLEEKLRERRMRRRNMETSE